MDFSLIKVFVIGAIVGPLGSFIVAEFEKSLESKLMVWQHMLALAAVGAILGLTLWTISEKMQRKGK